jgi:branched-chain amino acid aminotransferase
MPARFVVMMLKGCDAVARLFGMTDRKVHLNGQLVIAGQASISVGDPGLLHGASVFTTMRAHHGKVFRLEHHLERLAQSVRRFGLQVDATAQGLARSVDELLEANELDEARVRITLTPGPADGSPTTLVTAEALPEYPSVWYSEGISVVVTSFRQSAGDPVAGWKTGNYFARVLARQQAAEKGADEALWYTVEGRLAEACFCNVFLLRKGTLHTPPVGTPCLPGVVRGAVLELCGELGLEPDDQTPLTVHEILDAEEMFLTSSCAGIRPVVRVERHAVGEAKPGEATRKIMDAYRALLERECPS